MTIAKMLILMKPNLRTILAGFLSAIILFFDVASSSAFKGYDKPSGPPAAFNGGSRPGNGRPSGPAPYRRGEGHYRADPGRNNYRSDPGSRYYPGDRAPGRGQGYYRGDRGPGYYYRGQPSSPYGGPWRSGYGERRAISSRGDAQRMLNDYYTRRNMRIGPVRDKGFYYEADIMDRNNRFMDRVIIDKRSGRIRSIY